MRRVALVLATLAGLAFAPPAAADVVERRDAEGRTIRFDVRAATADVDWYADLLRNAGHGDEIAEVTIRIVPQGALDEACGAGAGGCYSRRRGEALIVVPAGRTLTVAHTVVHEYGHHVDAAHGVAGVPEPNGTPAWWDARGMGEQLAAGAVSRTYSRGWDRSIAEVFAEDYASLNLQTAYRISWLAAPDAAVALALRIDVAGIPEAPRVAPVGPLVLTRSGVLRPRAQHALPFQLVGPGRRITFTARVAGATRPGIRARMELRCDGRLVASRALRRRVASATIDLGGVGPARCSVALRSASAVRHRFSLRLRLAVEPG